VDFQLSFEVQAQDVVGEVVLADKIWGLFRGGVLNQYHQERTELESLADHYLGFGFRAWM
jgi:hypothetical protein